MIKGVLMRILGIILFEYILIFALQGFSFIIGNYAICKKKIETKKFIIAGVLFSIIICTMRLLPISFGIHTLLSLITIFIIGIFYLKNPPFTTIITQLILTVFLLIFEFIDTFAFMSILGAEKFNQLMDDGLYKNILGTPPSILFALFCFLIYFFLVIRKEKKSVAYGETSA